jgi:hypothetical protein
MDGYRCTSIAHRFDILRLLAEALPQREHSHSWCRWGHQIHNLASEIRTLPQLMLFTFRYANHLQIDFVDGRAAADGSSKHCIVVGRWVAAMIINHCANHPSQKPCKFPILFARQWGARSQLAVNEWKRK